MRKLMACLVALVATTAANAAVIVYTGSDPGVGPGGARPNSNAARNSFLAATGPVNPVINFTSAPLGAIPVGGLLIAPGVTLTATNNNSSAGIRNDGNEIVGYDTTTGAVTGRFARLQVPNSNLSTTSTFVFTFTQPVDAFGAFFTGVGTQNATTTILFNDGAPQSITIPGSDDGGVAFVGFTDFGKSISTITVRVQNLNNAQGLESIGVDDVLYRNSQPIPEPISLAVFGGLLVGGAGVALRRRMKATA